MPKRKTALPAKKFELGYQPSKKQQEMSAAIARGAKVILFSAGVRSGKTFAGIMECLKQVYQYQKKPNLGWIVSPTHDMSLSAEKKFVEFCQTPNGSLIAKHEASNHAYLLWPPSSMPGTFYRVEFKTAVEPQHLRGFSCAWILLDEAAAMKRGSEVFTIAQARVLDNGGIIIITTSPLGQNWLYHDVKLRTLEDPLWVNVEASTYDNPYLPSEEVARLEEQLKTKSASLARQEIYGKFEKFEGLVFDHFSIDENIIKSSEVPDGAPIYCGVDWGYNDPFVCVWLARIDGAWVVVDEYYKTHGLNKEHADYILAHPLAKKVKRYWCDPSNSQQRREFRALGIQMTPARRPKNDPRMDWPTARARLINSLFAQRVKSPFADEYIPALTFFDGIKHGVRECASLCYERFTEDIKDKKDEVIGSRVTDKFGREIDRNAKERIEDKNNHFVDALGYPLFSEHRHGPEMHPTYWDEKQGKVVTQLPKETLKDLNKRLWSEAFWRAYHDSKAPARKSVGEPYNTMNGISDLTFGR